MLQVYEPTCYARAVADDARAVADDARQVLVSISFSWLKLNIKLVKKLNHDIKLFTTQYQIENIFMLSYVRLKRSDGWGVAQSNPKHHCDAWGGSVLATSGALGALGHKRSDALGGCN